MTSDRRILVIGAGPSGLAAIKSCKEESLDVICYEKTKNFGGRWHFTENSISGVASVMKATICNSSKEIGAFSDFPPPKTFPNYMHHTKMLTYLTMYAEKFNLLRHIKFEREVIRIIPSSDFRTSGKWLATSITDFNGSEITEEYDAVMVCTGRLAQPVIPTFPNQNEFKGIMLHSQALKTTTAFENRNVLIVGNGNSAVDAAVEISTVAKQVHLSTRSGFWVYPKVGCRGLPFDMNLLRRDIHFLKNKFSPIVNHYVEKYLDSKINHVQSNIKPSHRALDKHPTINDDLADKILTGRIVIKGEISRFEKGGVVFENEDQITDIDSVVFATGYRMKLPFLDSDVYRNRGLPNLYKRVFPANMKHPTLAFIGFVECIGPDLPISESQCRWASRIFSKKLPLPPTEVLDSYMASMQSKIKDNVNELMEDYICYMDEVADEYGAKPNFSAMLFKDPSLFWTCFHGPFLPYQYRLVGPHCLDEARNIILEYDERVKEPFKTRSSQECDIKKGL